MLGLTSAELARVIGYPAERLVQLEEGQVDITVAELQHLAGTLEVPVTWFTEGARIEHELSQPSLASPDATVARLDESDQKAVLDAYFEMMQPEDRRKLVSIAHVFARGANRT